MSYSFKNEPCDPFFILRFWRIQIHAVHKQNAVHRICDVLLLGNENSMVNHLIQSAKDDAQNASVIHHSVQVFNITILHISRFCSQLLFSIFQDQILLVNSFIYSIVQNN
ncbi:unnamed protein product (macronuclear) [Paramecium tetraurelia]|uniref:Uncharacterized protein n=1 Tax=Paramecium tetraurelia TaxID=5888 RepID=A0EFN3_PARTE|nr:uncharacterized protein GSPATT00026447001 [Paramecium tetraurelia]CAK94124.1 unnamed protein product [Paramecium tetraurelia]|eukprot:XP_001461497.1 hypothetical protein (macronuclear) [Paramecium tetraurelia strain d4-2]